MVVTASLLGQQMSTASLLGQQVSTASLLGQQASTASLLSQQVSTASLLGQSLEASKSLSTDRAKVALDFDRERNFPTQSTIDEVHEQRSDFAAARQAALQGAAGELLDAVRLELIDVLLAGRPASSFGELLEALLARRSASSGRHKAGCTKEPTGPACEFLNALAAQRPPEPHPATTDPAPPMPVSSYAAPSTRNADLDTEAPVRGLVLDLDAPGQDWLNHEPLASLPGPGTHG